MTRDETKIIIRSISAAYPNYHPADLKETVDVWAAMLKSYDYKAVSEALQRYILSDKSGFAPAIGQITTLIGEKESSFMEPMAAWALVYKAICNSGYNSEAEFNKLPAEIQDAVGSPANLKEMSQMDIETVNSVEQSHFLRAYRTVVDRKKTDFALPPHLRIGAARQEAIEG